MTCHKSVAVGGQRAVTGDVREASFFGVVEGRPSAPSVKEVRPVNEKIIVLVSDRGDSRHGEISMVDDPQKAEKLVETLLEAGFERERIHVFAGRQSDFEVSQRPVVALVGEGEEDEPRVGVAEQEVAAAEPAPQAEETETGGSEGEESEREEEVPATVETATPVRFSSLFRSA
jgi:hypothetical protein